MQFVVLPLFNEWSRFCPTELSRTMLQNIKLNKEEWDTIIQQTKEVCSLVLKFVAFFCIFMHQTIEIISVASPVNKIEIGVCVIL